MSVENPNTFEEWCENLRKRPDRDVQTFRDIRNGGVKQQAGAAVWQEREDAKQRKIRDEEFQRMKEFKQEREAEYTLWTYWRLADWSERFGMFSFFVSVFVVGYLCSKIELVSRAIDLIRSIKP
jgi:hypothetical protein